MSSWSIIINVNRVYIYVSRVCENFVDLLMAIKVHCYTRVGAFNLSSWFSNKYFSNKEIIEVLGDFSKVESDFVIFG